MTRKKKLLYSTTAGVFYQATTIICGFILPRFFIAFYGSAVNGLINSITQFLGFITMIEAGMGAVVQSSLYKPLADNDNYNISRVLISSRKFFNKIAAIMMAYSLLLMIVYPFIVKEEFGFIYTSSLVFILALSYFAQHYLFLSYRLLLNADQLAFINLGVHSVCLILNCILTIVLIKMNVEVHVVKAVSTAVFAVQPLALKIYVDHHYSLNLKIVLNEEPIQQKWNGLAQHISTVVLGSTDTIILTVFSTLENVSVYNVYYLVVHGVRQIINSAMTGVQALLGNMLAKKEFEELKKTFNAIELCVNDLVLILFSITGVLIVPFVKVYTDAVTDVDYIQPTFGLFITLAYAAYSLQTPYEMLVKAAGHYKQTQTSYFIEVGINIVLSLVLVIRYGLVGVAIGTFTAMMYRTFYLVYYLSKNIIFRSPKRFFKLMIMNIICVTIIIFITKKISLSGVSYMNLILMAIKVGLIVLLVVLGMSVLLFKNTIKDSLVFMRKRTR